MSLSTRSPTRVAGGNYNSGAPYTGEQTLTLGGDFKATIWSGMVSGVSLAGAPGAVCGVNTAGGADVLFFSGAGRLKDVLVFNTYAGIVSGGPVVFYDSPTPTSGGPFAASGHKIIGIIPAGLGFGPGGSSGFAQVVNGQVLAFDMPFNSGLCANLKSGAPGFTVTYDPESIPQPPYAQ